MLRPRICKLTYISYLQEDILTDLSAPDDLSKCCPVDGAAANFFSFNWVICFIAHSLEVEKIHSIWNSGVLTEVFEPNNHFGICPVITKCFILMGVDVGLYYLLMI